MTSFNEKAVLDLSGALADLTNYHDLPECLQETIGKYLRFDWLGLFSAPARGEIYSVTSNPHLPFNWDELYQEVAPHDVYRERLLDMPVGQPLIQAEIRNPNNEIENYCLEFVKKQTNTVHMMGMSTVNDDVGLFLVGIYRSDPRNPFSRADKQLLKHISPVLRCASKHLMLCQHSNVKRVAYDAVFQEADIHPTILNDKLQIIDLPLSTLAFLRQIFDDPLLEDLPSPISQQINRHATVNGQLELNTGPWRFRVKASEGDVQCHAYVVSNERRQPLLILKLEKHGNRADFSALTVLSVTQREIETLSYLPLGYTNRQIALAMGITADGVKKHLRNAARKLGAQGRAETLFRAMTFTKPGLLV